MHEDFNNYSDNLRGSETILIVDDEMMITNVVKIILENFGYKVIIANGGQQAISIVETNGDKIDMIILDLVMPDLDGEKVFEFVRNIHPDMPVILSSGYCSSDQVEKIMSRGCNSFVSKPYKSKHLVIEMRKIFEEKKNEKGSLNLKGPFDMLSR